MNATIRTLLRAGAAMMLATTAVPTAAQQSRDAIQQREADADRWAAATGAKMTDDGRFGLIHGFMALRFPGFGDMNAKWPDDIVPGAGYVAGVPRLGVPSLRETDASLGITNPVGVRAGDTATALPAGLALGATFNPELAYRAGRLVGEEARARVSTCCSAAVSYSDDPRHSAIALAWNMAADIPVPKRATIHLRCRDPRW